MKSFIQNKTNRRNFFSLAGKGTIGAILLSVFPIKLLSKSKNYKKLVKVNIHTEAVKRVK